MVTLLRSDPSHDGASINKDNNPSAPPSERQTNAESSISPLCRLGGRMEAEPCYFPALSQHSRIVGFSFFSLRKTKAPTTDNKYIKLISKGLCSTACCKLQQTSTCLSLVDMAEQCDSPRCQWHGGNSQGAPKILVTILEKW